MPLPIFAVQRLQHFQLMVGFDAFGDDCEIETLSQPDDRAHDFKALLVRAHRVNKRSVDLKVTKGKPVQVTQRRVARAEVVNADVDTKRFQLAEHLDGCVSVHEHALANSKWIHY